MIEKLTPEQVREVTETVLRRQEFQDDPSKAWFIEIFQRFIKWLSGLSEWSSAHPEAARVLIIVLGIILLALLGHIGYTMVTELRSTRRQDLNLGTRHHKLPALEGVADNWNDAFALAGLALQSGDLYRALWITHRILLSVLDIRKAVRFARWKTNTDYVRECKTTDEAAATLREITNAYERVVYAHGEFDRDEAARLVDRVRVFAGEVNR